MHSFAPGALAWLGTLTVHSTVLLAVAWVLTRLRINDPVREAVWKAAMLGALVTASVQFAIGVEPFGGHLVSVATEPARPVIAPAPATVGAERIAVPDAPEPVDWRFLVLLAAASAAALALLVDGLEALRLRRRLATREHCSDPIVVAALDRVRRSIGVSTKVRLSVSQQLATPIAFGVLRPEICLPEAVGERLDAAQLDGLLAHEIAHLQHRDPLWLRVFATLTSLFPWQPLFRLGRREFQRVSEFRCDADAAELASSVSVASCLVEVAGWVGTGDASLSAMSAGMAANPSMLERRVDRLLDEPRGRRVRPIWLVPVLTCLLASVTLAMPGFTATPLPRAASRGASLIDVLSELDDECADLAKSFTALQRDLAGVELDEATVRVVAALAYRLNQLDQRRIDLRIRILESLGGARRLEHEARRK